MAYGLWSYDEELPFPPYTHALRSSSDQYRKSPFESHTFFRSYLAEVAFYSSPNRELSDSPRLQELR